MRNVVLGIFSAFLLLGGFTATAQNIVTNSGKDTAIGYYGTSQLEVHNNLKSTSTPTAVNWTVTGSFFDAGWDMIGSGFCDNTGCYTAFPTDNLFTNGSTRTSDPYGTTAGDFHMLFVNTGTPADGTSSWVRVKVQEVGSLGFQTLTFIGYKSSTGVSVTMSSNDDIVLYPNPAKEAVNVIFDNKSGIKNIAIYNLIGKMVSPVYRPSSNGSAKIDVNELPSGVYFIRLMDGQGHIVATRRFVHQ